MSVSFSYSVAVPCEDVFAWHTRPGAMTRLTPPWVPVRARSEAVDLRDGQAVLSVAGLWRWVAQHQADAYDPPRRFADELVSAPFGLLRWRHTHTFKALGEALSEVADEVETNLPAFALGQMFAYRERQLRGDLAAHAWAARYRPEALTVAMTGSSGFIGANLRAFLTSGGHRVVRLVRRAPSRPDERYWDVSEPSLDLFEGVDALVHLGGAPIAGRFSEDHKRAVENSRSGPTQRLAEAAARAKARGYRLESFISASAVGYYGYDRGDQVLTEDAERGDGFLADVVERWEAATEPAQAGGLRVANVRTGLVQSPRGGMMKVLYPLFLAGLGGRQGSGRQWVPWVGIDDIVDIYLRLLVDENLSGPVNGTAPAPVRNLEYTGTLARVLRRPALVAVPAWAPALVLGQEGTREFALSGQRAVPALLGSKGHPFRYPELEGGLRHLLGRWPLGPGSGPSPAAPAPEKQRPVLSL